VAIELLITNRDTGTLELAPVATSDVFRRYWRKGCAELKLHLIPRFEDGIQDFTRSEVPMVIKELQLLGKWFEKTQSPKEASALIGRVNSTTRAFERVLKDPQLSIG